MYGDLFWILSVCSREAMRFGLWAPMGGGCDFKFGIGLSHRVQGYTYNSFETVPTSWDVPVRVFQKWIFLARGAPSWSGTRASTAFRVSFQVVYLVT